MVGLKSKYACPYSQLNFNTKYKDPMTAIAASSSDLCYCVWLFYYGYRLKYYGSLFLQSRWYW